MLIGIDASRAAIEQRTGTENYSLNLIRSLLDVGASRHTFILYFNRPPSPGLFFPSAYCRIKAMPFRRLWTHLRLSWEMSLKPPDVLFVPAHVLPVIHPRRSVVTIHDLGYLYYPEAYHRWDRLYLGLSTRYNARAVAHIIAVSETTKKDIVNRLGIDPARVTVIYSATDFKPITGDRQITDIKSHYGIENEYILYLGTLQPRKNVVRLLQAYSRLRRKGRISASLVIAGKKGWLSEEIVRQLQQVKDGIVLTGFVPPEDLPPLMSGAAAFVMPSLFEGFCLPVVEAMACGTPVIAANSSALPEIVGDAALLVNPLSVEDMAEGICQVMSNRDLREHLHQKGLARSQQFSWHRCAQETLSVLERVGHPG